MRAEMSDPWVIVRGDPEQLTLEVHTGTETGPTTDLSGKTWKAQWRPTEDSPDEDALTIAVSTALASSGTLVLSLTTTQTAAMTQDGVFDVQEVGGGTLLFGRTRLEADVTR